MILQYLILWTNTRMNKGTNEGDLFCIVELLVNGWQYILLSDLQTRALV